MRSYIAQLYKHLEEEDAKRVYARQQKTTMKPVPKPLETQLVEFFHSLPEADLRRPWLMHELVTHMDGRYRADPSPQKIAEVLRKLGWRRVRIYEQWGGRRHWLPKSDVGS